MIIRIAALLLLCHASLPILAGESRIRGNGDCTPPAIGMDDGEHARPAEAHAGSADPRSGDKEPAARRGGSAEGGMRGPRMHNLLPGMFR